MTEEPRGHDDTDQEQLDEGTEISLYADLFADFFVEGGAVNEQKRTAIREKVTNLYYPSGAPAVTMAVAFRYLCRNIEELGKLFSICYGVTEHYGVVVPQMITVISELPFINLRKFEAASWVFREGKGKPVDVLYREFIYLLNLVPGHGVTNDDIFEMFSYLIRVGSREACDEMLKIIKHYDLHNQVPDFLWWTAKIMSSGHVDLGRLFVETQIGRRNEPGEIEAVAVAVTGFLEDGDDEAAAVFMQLVQESVESN